MDVSLGGLQLSIYSAGRPGENVSDDRDDLLSEVIYWSARASTKEKQCQHDVQSRGTGRTR